MTEHMNSYEEGDIVLMGVKFLGFIPMEEEEAYVVSLISHSGGSVTVRLAELIEVKNGE